MSVSFAPALTHTWPFKCIYITHLYDNCSVTFTLSKWKMYILTNLRMELQLTYNCDQVIKEIIGGCL